jgi:tRNA(Ile)-lysidine synthase
MALLELLALASAQCNCRVTAAYVDHGLRPEARDEAAFVGRRARQLGLEFKSLTIDDPGRGDEDHLRNCRYRLLEQVRIEANAEWIATAHTRDDQTETIIFRLLRGAGLGGLAGIPSRRGHIVRPILGAGREELEGFLRDRAVTWVEDPSNRDQRYARNRIRHEIIPAIKKAFGSGGLDHLPDVALRWRIDEDFLTAETRRHAAFALRQGKKGLELDLGALAKAPAALQPRILRYWLAGAGGPDPPSIAQLQSLEKLLDRPRQLSGVDLPGARVVVKNGRLHLLSR